MSKYLIEAHIKKILAKSLEYAISEKLVTSKTSIKILDLGCGNKPYKKLIERYLTRHNINVEYIGVDYYAPSAELKLDLNKEKLPFPNEYFDFILCTEVLEHLYNPFNCINEIKRLAKKKGVIVITTPFMYPVHDKNNDYFRYTENFFRYYFSKKDGYDIILLKKSNKYLSLFILLIENYIPVPKKIINFLDNISNLVFKRRFFNEAHYMDIGCIIIKNGEK